MRAITVFVTLAFVATAATAQQQTPATPGQAPAPARGWVQGGLPAYLSTNPGNLNLNNNQLTRIRQANDRLQTANTALREQVAAATANRNLATMSLADRHALMMNVRGLRARMQANADSATAAVIAVLTPEQQRQIEAMRPGTRMGGMGMMRGGVGRPMRGMVGPGRGMRGVGRAMRPGMRMGVRFRGPYFE